MLGQNIITYEFLLLFSFLKKCHNALLTMSITISLMSIIFLLLIFSFFEMFWFVILFFKEKWEYLFALVLFQIARMGRSSIMLLRKIFRWCQDKTASYTFVFGGQLHFELVSSELWATMNNFDVFMNVGPGAGSGMSPRAGIGNGSTWELLEGGGDGVGGRGNQV